MKLRYILLFALLLSLSITACSGTPANKLRDDIPVTTLTSAADLQLNADALRAMEESYLIGAMKLNTALFSEYSVKVNAVGANIDEYGIFKISDSADPKTAETAVSDYLKMRLDTWMEGYMPEEKPKLEKAEYKVFGSYIVYAILSDSQKKAVFDSIETELRKV